MRTAPSTATSTSLHQVSIYDHRHLAQRAGARLQRPQPGIDRLDGAVDSPADMRHHQPLHRPLHRESHAALEEGLCLVIQGSGFGEVAQYVDVDMRLAPRSAGLPFVPFDVFDWMTRILPGQVIAVGIGVMVTVIRALNLGPTAAAAKTAEHVMAIAGMFFTGLIAGIILFSITRALRGRYARTLGLAMGIAMGVLVVFISHQAGQTASTGAGLSAVWVIGITLLWGTTLGWAYQQVLVAAGTVTKPAAENVVERIDRRRFLVRLGSATAVVTVIGAVVGELSEAKRKRVSTTTKGKDLLWSSTHPLPNTDAAVKPAPGTRPEFTPLERHYRIDIDTIPPVIDPEQ